MDAEACDNIVRFLESKDDKERAQNSATALDNSFPIVPLSYLLLPVNEYGYFLKPIMSDHLCKKI